MRHSPSVIHPADLNSPAMISPLHSRPTQWIGGFLVMAAVTLTACSDSGVSTKPRGVEPAAGPTRGAFPTSPRAREMVAAMRAQAAAHETPMGAALLEPVGPAADFEQTADGLRPRFPGLPQAPSARVVLPTRATAPLQIQDVSTGISVAASLVGASDSVALQADGYLVFEHGHTSGATVFNRPTPDGVEDLLSFEKRPARPEIAYRLKLQPNVGLRLVANTLEILDGEGAPRLRIAPPYVVGADGIVSDAALSLEGCRFDSTAAAPWGRSVTPPGNDWCTVRVAWNDAQVAYPAVLDPRWTSTASMVTPRQGHTATVLASGKVLLAGGSNGTNAVATAELYDPATRTWAATGSMSGARQLHAAVQLGTSANPTTSGKVLVIGGLNGTASLSTAQLYSPAVGTWAPAAALNAARHQQTATLLANGRVLIAGGMSGTGVLNTAAVYDPATGAGSWTAVNNLSSARRFHTAVLLSGTTNSTLKNKVLVVGGNSGGTTSVATVQLFDGVSSWTTLGSLSSAREGHTATALANGNVLVVGGRNGSTTLSTTLLFNTSSGSGSWSSAGTLSTARQAHRATLLPAAIVKNGSVLVTGGRNASNSLGTAELWNGTNAWTATPLLAPVQDHTASLLNDSTVLIAGGVNGTTTLNSANVYDASFGLACTSNAQCSSGFCVSGVCCDTACTGDCRACDLAGNVGTCSPRPNGSSCDDQNACTGSSSCQAGACVGASPVAVGTTCGDADACNGVETCDGNGTCLAGAPVVCVPTDECSVAGTCNPVSGACSTPSGSGCTVESPCTDPMVCPSSANVPDRTADLEPGCTRLRDIAVRFLDYRDASQGASPLDDPNFIQSAIADLNGTYARACVTFHERGHARIQNTKFSHYTQANAFDWADPADSAQWTLAAPHNPTCAFNPPSSGKMSPGAALTGYILQSCVLNDELTIVTAPGTGGGSDYPSRVVVIPSAAFAPHETGHNFGLVHSFAAVQGITATPGTGGRPQDGYDWFSLLFVRGSTTVPDRFFSSRLDLFNAIQAGASPTTYFNEIGIYLPGQYVDPAGNVTTCSIPPKTGPVSCDNPPNGLGPCSMQLNADPTVEQLMLLDDGAFCFNCEWRRMYETTGSSPRTFPPADGLPLGFLYAAGQTLRQWRMTGTLLSPLSGVVYEKQGVANTGSLAALAPTRTKIQTRRDPHRTTQSAMSYNIGWRLGLPWDERRPGTAGFACPVPAPFTALSDSEVELVKNAMRYDLVDDSPADPTNFGKFGHRPAYGSWEKIGQNLAVDSMPAIVAEFQGVFLAAKTQDGQIAYRHLAYSDPPWAPWHTLLPIVARTPSGAISATSRQDDFFDIAIHQQGADDEIETALVVKSSGGAGGWQSLGGAVRGVPLIKARSAAEGAHLNVVVLGRSGTPANDYYYFDDWSPVTSDWSGWINFPFLPGTVDDSFDTSVRPDGSVDIVAKTSDGRWHNAFIGGGSLGTWGWGDIGSPGSLGGYRPSVSSIVNKNAPPFTPFVQIDVVATDGAGTVFHKAFTDVNGAAWTPSQTGWNSLGGSNFGRAVVTHSRFSDIDVVARDLSRHTVRFKRFRQEFNVWSPAADWFDLGGEGVNDPIAITREGDSNVVDVFSLSQDGTLWHRAFVVPGPIPDDKGQQMEMDYMTHCCSFTFPNPACPCQ